MSVVLVTGPSLAGVSAVAAVLRDRLPRCTVTEPADLAPGAVVCALVFVVSAAAHLTGSDCAVLDGVARNTDAVVCVVSKIDVHRGWREVIAADRGVLAAHAPRYARVPWVGAAARPELGEADIDDFVRVVRDQLSDPGLARRNRLRAQDSRLQARVDALRTRRATALRERRREALERAAGLRGQLQQARVQLSFVVRHRCSAVRSELQERAAGLSRRHIPGFESHARARLAAVGAEVCEAVDARLAAAAREISGGGVPPYELRENELRENELREIPVPSPPLTSRRLETWLMATLGAGFGVGLAVTLSRLVGGLVTRFAPGLAPAAAAACVLTGLVGAAMVVHVRGLLHDRALLDRWVGEAAASLRAVVEERVATRVLAAESALAAALAAGDEAADAHLAAVVGAIDGELRAQEARRRQMSAILAPAATCEEADTRPGVHQRPVRDNL